MMSCFTILEMHWRGHLLWENFGAISIIVIVGIFCGILWRSPVRDTLYSLMIAALTCLIVRHRMVELTYAINPPYCWGDVWRRREALATRPLTVGEALLINLSVTVAVFALSFLFAIILRRVFHKETRPQANGSL
jgi:hypothetical protein